MALNKTNKISELNNYNHKSRPDTIFHNWGVKKTVFRLLSSLINPNTSLIFNDVARFLGVKRMSVHEAVPRGKTLWAEDVLQGQERE